MEEEILLAHSLSGPSSSWQSLRGSKKLFGGRNWHTGFLASPQLSRTGSRSRTRNVTGL